MGERRAFTLIELMIVVAIIAIIAAIAVPNLIAARVTANEATAISTLRLIASGQSQFKAQTAVDVDADGAGEHGWIQELTSSDNLRASLGVGGLSPPLNPSILPGALGLVSPDATGAAVVQKGGYLFKIYLPDPAGGAVGEPIPIAVGAESPNLCERNWVCYAWPVDQGTTGRRVFVTNQSGDVLQMANSGLSQYDGDGLDPGEAVPPGDAAFITAGNITSQFSIRGRPLPAVDGNLWTTL